MAAPDVTVEVEQARELDIVVGGVAELGVVAAGNIGPQGPPGVDGDDGATGPPGSTGAQGVEGPQGPQGVQGPVGQTGPQGPDGVGVVGADGPRGPAGPQGNLGPQGPQGVQGELGPQGVQGELGPQGPEGTVPVVSLEQAAYDALTPDPETLYVITDAPLTGEQGPPGPAGPAGAAGAQGPAGSQGPAGPAGSQGPAGAAGSQGAAGPQGPMGEVTGMGVSQPNQPWLPAGAILESFARASAPLTAQSALSLGAIRSWPVGTLRAGHTATGLGFITGAAAAGTTNSWAGIATFSDHVIRAISATSVAATPGNVPRIFDFATPYTPTVDEFLIGFIMYAGGTVPTVMGFAHTAGVTGPGVGPVLCASHQVGQTTPPAVGAVLAPITAINQQLYLYLLGSTP